MSSPLGLKGASEEGQEVEIAPQSSSTHAHCRGGHDFIFFLYQTDKPAYLFLCVDSRTDFSREQREGYVRKGLDAFCILFVSKIQLSPVLKAVLVFVGGT